MHMYFTSGLGILNHMYLPCYPGELLFYPPVPLRNMYFFTHGLMVLKPLNPSQVILIMDRVFPRWK